MRSCLTYISKFWVLFFAFALPFPSQAQSDIRGRVLAEGNPLPFANVFLKNTQFGTASDHQGDFEITGIPDGTYTFRISSQGFKTYSRKITIPLEVPTFLSVEMEADAQQLDETVVSGTLKPVNRLESPVPVEIYAPSFFRKNPTPNIFEALQNVNGVRPQINCNVCNTGDIHINGLEGPYTLVLIDGMPIVSGLGTVYGLSGIPNALIDRIEVVKGPASSLYGSEAVGGLINVITKFAPEAPDFFADSFLTGWGEYNLDLGARIQVGNRSDLLLGVNYFHYDNPIDNNGDNFTDVTLQERISVFQKWNFPRDEGRVFSLAGRFYYEDRWGGEMQWTPEFRGGTEIYGESIYTRRWEVLGQYQLPLPEKLMFSFSYNDHNQNSVYGDLPYLADQRIGFGQLSWDKKIGKHDVLIGSAVRYNYYNDNTPATTVADNFWLPGIFVQDEFEYIENHTLLIGARWDYDQRHGSIFTPRFAYKYKLGEHGVLRLNAGSGFRVVNLFTEEHAALTGARDVVITEALKPERSFNLNLNYLQKIYAKNGTFIGLDASAFYTRFSNLILPDYDTDPNLIIYDNLDGTAVSRGLSANLDLAFPSGIKVLLGGTLLDVHQEENGEKTRPVLTESYTATWNISYDWRALDLNIDYTGNLYGPMRLPLLGELDPRRPYSPAWSIQNIQFTYTGLTNMEVYTGVKNLLDWTPNEGNPFIIARANDPFDRDVQFDGNGAVIPTAQNPYALTFDPSYVYGPNQGIRAFLGLRYRID